VSSEQPVVIELNPREQRVYDRLRSQVIEAEPGGASGIRDLLLLLPDLAVLLFRLMRDDRVPIASKAMAIFGIGYLISPIDLMPALLLGPIGLIDDLIVIGAVLSRMLNRVHPDVVRSHWSGQGDALEAIQRVAAWSERNVGDRVRSLASWVMGRRQRVG
jgi:uncharacterized membrane protein YkvA (DUF1232 family)